MRVNTLMVLNKVMVYFLGKMGLLTKESLKIITLKVSYLI